MRKNKLFFYILLSFCPLFLARGESEFICAVYFTGVGCSHCAKTDSVILEKILRENENFIVLEYEIYQRKENAYILSLYCDNLNLSYCKPFDSFPCCGIPLIIFGKEKKDIIVGNSNILENIEEKIRGEKGSKLFLLKGPFDFKNLKITKLLGFPKI